MQKSWSLSSDSPCPEPWTSVHSFPHSLVSALCVPVLCTGAHTGSAGQDSPWLGQEQTGCSQVACLFSRLIREAEMGPNTVPGS